MRSIYILGVAASIFLWRYLLTWFRGKALRGVDDNIVHMYTLKRLSDKPGCFKILEEDRFLVNKKITYPQLFHKLVALIWGFDRFKRIECYLNPLFESIFMIVLFLFSEAIILNTPLKEKALTISLWVCILYIFSPLFFFFEGRVANFGERLFSYILGMISILLTLSYFQLHDLTLLLPVLLINITIIYASQFTLQAIILLQGLFSVLSVDPFPFLTVVVAVLLSFLLTPRITWGYIQGKYNHFKWYFRALANKKMSLRYVYEKYWRKMAVYGLVFILLAFMPKDVFFLFNQNIFKGFFYYIIASLIIFFLVYLPIFRPFGEAHRYLEYSLPFALIIFVYSVFVRGNWSMLLLLLTVNVLSSFHHILKSNLMHSDYTESFELVEFLKKYPGKVFMTIPLKIGFFLLTYLNNRVLESTVLGGEFERILKSYSFPINDFEKIRELYPFDWIIYRKGSDLSYDFSGLRIMYQNSVYIVFEMKNQS